MKKGIKIGSKLIGEGQSVFIIAEAGVNHNGKLNLAYKLVDAAINAGADAVKFQTFKAEDVVIPEGKMASYQSKNLEKSGNQLEMLKKYELSEVFHQKLIAYCKKKKIIFLSTPHGSFNSVDFLQSLNISAFKFGSGDLTNIPLLKYAAQLKKMILISTGMGTMKEVKDAIGAIQRVGNNKIIVLHCTTNYPCPPDEVNLRAMQTMMKELEVPVGYSDHTTGLEASFMAATLGACVIERHLTLDRNMRGPDHNASLEPHELKKLVDMIRKIETLFGSSQKKPNDSEQSMIKTVRKSVVTEQNIKKGEVFTQDNLSIKRPGDGLKPVMYTKILGRKSTRNIQAGKKIKMGDYA